MKEILGASLDNAFAELGIKAKKTFEINNKHWDYCEDYQVWELSDKDFELLCNIKEQDWKDDWGWWRFAEGSNLGGVYKRYKINRRYILAWDGYTRQNDRDYPEKREYVSLLQYFCNEIGASTEKNVCAVATDLAKQNNLTIAQLFAKYQG